MDRIAVQSSNISSIWYNEETETLEIEFLNWSVYEYKNVPLVVYEALMSAPSHGVYLNAYIKNVYPYEQIG